MIEKNIQQVLEIEKQAQEMQDKAKREALEVPAKAEQEVQALIAKAKANAENEARKILASVQSEANADKIMADVDKKSNQDETLAKKNFDKAVAFVLERVIGRA